MKVRLERPGGIWTKAYPTVLKAEGLNDVTLPLIRRYAVGDVKPEEISIWKMDLCNTDYDRADERFPVEYLQRFAETLPGKSLMTGHNYSNSPAGRFIGAEVMPRADGGHVLATRFYTRSAAPISDDLRLGIAKDGSIGFMPDDRTCDLCGKSYDRWFMADEGEDYCTHIQSQFYDDQKCTLTYGGDTSKVEAVEGSLVWLGCQYGAQTTAAAAVFATKAAHVQQQSSAQGGTRQEERMTLQEAEAKIAALEAKAKEHEAEDKERELFAKESGKYRDFLKSEVLRFYKSMGDEATGVLFVDAYSEAPIEKLESAYKTADEKHSKHFAGTRGETGGADGGVLAETRSHDEIMFGRRAARGGG